VPFVSSPPGTQTVQTIPGGRAGEALVRETTASVVLLAPPGTATLEGALAAGALDEDAAPSLGRGREETMAAVLVLTPAFTDRAQVSLVGGGRGLPRLPRRFVGLRVAGLDGIQHHCGV
jgi:hypothetical protein